MGFFDSIGDMEFGKSYYELAGLVKDEIKETWQEKKAVLSESEPQANTILENLKDDFSIG